MAEIWENVTTTNNGNDTGSQTVAMGALRYEMISGDVTEIIGQVSLQRKTTTPEFRVLAEGQSTTGEPLLGALFLAIEATADWKVNKPSGYSSRNAGKALVIVVDFSNDPNGVKTMQLTFPLKTGNSRKAQWFSEGIAFAYQCKKEANAIEQGH